MSKYPPYHCDVLAEKALSLQKQIEDLTTEALEHERKAVELRKQIPDLKDKKDQIMDYLHTVGLPHQAL